MTERHVAGDLGVYLAGAMEQREGWALESHLGQCGWCTNELRELQQVTALLEGMPPEVLLDGPPDGGDLLLRRTMRQIRKETGRGRWVVRGVAAAVMLGVAGLGVGFVYGQQNSPPVIVTSPGSQLVESALSGRAVDPTTGASMAVALLPTAGWVRLSVDVDGIPPGQRCHLVVVAHDGRRETAFSWLTGDPSMDGVPLTGSVLVAPEDVAAVEVQSEDGRTYVSVDL